MYFLNIHLVCIQWGRARFVKRGLGNLGCGICGGAAEGQLGWPVVSVCPVPISPELPTAPGWEHLLPGVPSLAVRQFRSCKAGAEAYDGSLSPKLISFPSFPLSSPLLLLLLLLLFLPGGRNRGITLWKRTPGTEQAGDSEVCALGVDQLSHPSKCVKVARK